MVSTCVISRGIFNFCFILSLLYFEATFNKTNTLLTLAGDEIVILNLVLCASWSIYHVTSNAFAHE